jgi:predicted ATPase/class 3 adenylate cyclase
MICGACRHENREGAKFCESCGAKLERRCPACGQPVGEASRFCDGCGQRLDAAAAAPAAPAAPTIADHLAQRFASYTPRHLADKILTSRAALEGERKLVSVLFADCAGFTEVSTRLDPEDLHAVMDGCFQRLLDAVHRYEGTINQFTGDGVMALFGAPIAHEDHAVRAVAAALAMQRTAREYSETLQRERGFGLSLRIGVNTGPVVVGRIGDDLRMDYTAQGETVNLAARLQTAAEPGGVLVSEAVHALVEGYFVSDEVGPLALKGLAAPVGAFAVRSRRRRARFELAVERGLTPLAGREQELAFLKESVERARAGRTQLISLVGDAGVGKSRLAWELRRAVSDSTVTCLEAHCAAHADALPFAVIGQLLRANFGMDEGEPEAGQVKKVEAGVRELGAALEWAIPYLNHLLALPAPSLEADGLDQAQRRRRMMEAVKALVLAGAARRPILFIIEDLQWIDRNSEELLVAVNEGLAGHRVVFLTTYRPGYTAPWQDRSFHQRLAVDPLGEEEVRAIAAALLSGSDAPAELQQLVVARSGGNPLFAEELVRFFRAQGAKAALADAEVPATIHDLITARIDRLAESVKRTLQLASVLGTEFALPLLEALAPRETGLAADLAELVRLELLRERESFPEARYAFAHLLVRQVAYEELLLKTRAELHARAGAALERLYAGHLDEVLRELADHYARSAVHDKALDYLARAGDRAASLFAYREAEGYYRRALELVDRRPELGTRRLRVLDRLAEAAFANGEIEAARAPWLECLALAQAAGDQRHVADLHRKIAIAAWAAGSREETLSHLEQGLAALGADVDNREAARLIQELARVNFRLGDQMRAMQLAEHAVGLGAQLDAKDVVADAYNTWGVALARAGDLEQGADLVARCLETALDQGLGSVACRAYVNLAVMYGPIDRARALGYARDGLKLAQRIGDQLQQSWLYCTLASGHCSINGDYDEGIRAAEAGIELDRRLGQRSHLAVPLIILAQVHQCRGDADSSRRYYEEALGLAEEIGEPQLLVPCYDGLGTLAIERGDEADADRWLERGRAVQELTGGTSETFLVLPFLC